MNKKTIAIIGLGYVGLPLAVEFAKKRRVIGFDIKQHRINELLAGHDPTLEVSDQDLAQVLIATQEGGGSAESSGSGLVLTSDIESLRGAHIYIVAVPTPTDKNNRPDLTPLVRASETVGKVLKKGDIVIYESTVYPGATEEDCVPVLERVSGMKYRVDFGVGYSPERINPGDKEHTLTTIKKVTSGSSAEIATEVNDLYNEIIVAGTHLASSIRVAEAAKVIENSQRDINIAFVNELSKIFRLMGIDTLEVLEAAGSKWNFLPFRPGLVGGHCIGVDPFYLAQKAQEVGYHPEIILAGRRLNDSMGAYVASETVKLMIQKGHKILDSKVLVLGITFKENCPDIRNSRVIDIINELKSFGCAVDVYDPWANPDEVKHEYGINILTTTNPSTLLTKYQAIVLAVAHNQFKSINFQQPTTQTPMVIFDVKSILPKNLVTGRL
jgi:UDP-N-acetyl-D-galactosamine dehydrogenase